MTDINYVLLVCCFAIGLLLVFMINNFFQLKKQERLLKLNETKI